MPTLRDAIYGLAVGDALGVPYEFRPRGSFACTGMVGYGTHDQPAGTWSDDTSMTLATCDSIRACGRVDTADMLERFRAWIDGGAYAIDGVVFDYGNTTARALAAGAGCTGERDNGNGSLMRIAPLAFTDATDDEVRTVSAITHAHPVSTEACVDMVCVMRALAAGASPVEAILTTRSFSPPARRTSAPGLRAGHVLRGTLVPRGLDVLRGVRVACGQPRGRHGHHGSRGRGARGHRVRGGRHPGRMDGGAARQGHHRALPLLGRVGAPFCTKLTDAHLIISALWAACLKRKNENDICCPVRQLWFRKERPSWTGPPSGT